ncbi:MAG: GIY-YIG nuclease family protein [Cyanobacteria bacterium P01_G01_bin.54]
MNTPPGNSRTSTSSVLTYSPVLTSAMPYVYILQCADGSFYTGSTTDLPRRLWQHQNGYGANHTRKRRPVELVFAEWRDRVDEAFEREKQIQGWGRKKKLALIESDWDKLRILAECNRGPRFRRDGRVTQ